MHCFLFFQNIFIYLVFLFFKNMHAFVVILVNSLSHDNQTITILPFFDYEQF